MSDFFTTPERLAQLQAAVAAWQFTPFMHMACLPGIGVDCVHLAADILQRCGAMGPYDFGSYPLDWGLHQEDSLITSWADASGRFVRVEPASAAMAGDVVCFQIGLCVNHCGVMMDGVRFTHVLTRGRVCLGQTDDSTWQKRLACYYRPQEVSA